MVDHTIDELSYTDQLRTCPCVTCKTKRRYIKKNPGKQRLKDYYIRNRNDILLTKAFERYKSGIKTQQRTLDRLLAAGYPVTGPGIPESQQAEDNILRFVRDGSIKAAQPC
jgi:hypothetical protein